MLLRRQQVGAWLLVAAYWIAFALSIFGPVKAIGYFSDARSSGQDAGGYILGFVALAATFIWAGFTASSALKLWGALQRRSVHSLRRRALATFIMAVIGLAGLSYFAGKDVLESNGTGLSAVFLVFVAMVSLSAYGANRSLSE